MIDEQIWVKRNNKPILIRGYAPIPQTELIKAFYLMESGHCVGFDMETGNVVDLCCERTLS